MKKKQIPTPVAVAAIALAAIGLVGLSWFFGGKDARVRGDVRPIINEMNVGKVKTEPLPPDTDVLAMGAGSTPVQKSTGKESQKKKK
jgi:hypothetical protein